MHKHRSATYRFFEMLPGILTWTILLSSVLLSFWKPLWVIYFIIVFALYWFIRVSYFVLYLTLSWWRFQRDRTLDWRKELEKKFPGEWERYVHLIFLPTYREPIEVIFSTLEGLSRVDYPLDKLSVLVGLEERDPGHAEKRKALERSRFANVFGRFIVMVHELAPDEMAGKGSNAHSMGVKIKRIIDEEGIDYQTILVSNFDVDTVVDQQYFSYFTHTFLSHPHRYRASYQPIALYNNNIWTAPSFARVVANSTTFWLMTELARPERMFTFSSHSMTWQALVDVGFWDKTIVTEDSRIFVQCYIHYHGDYQVTPMYIPVNMDTVVSHDLRRTALNQYKQQMRWAYGVEHFPFMVVNFHRDKLIPWKSKFKYLFNLSEGMISWATAPILITILGRLPLYVAAHRNYMDAVVHNAPFVLEWLMRLAMIGIFASAIVNVLLSPRPQRTRGRWRAVVLVLQWLLLPITLILFGSMPAIHAQTRLMLGKYMGFWNTEKVR